MKVMRHIAIFNKTDDRIMIEVENDFRMILAEI
jgi:hypothetical protein